MKLLAVYSTKCIIYVNISLSQVSTITCLCIACSNGTFGEGCKLTCGHCYGNSACDHVNGSCVSGCASGWTGTVCNKSERIRILFLAAFQCHHAYIETKMLILKLRICIQAIGQLSSVYSTFKNQEQFLFLKQNNDIF